MRCEWFDLADETTKGPNRQPGAKPKVSAEEVMQPKQQVKLLLPTVRTVKVSPGPPGKSPGSGGRLGLMREIRPADTNVSIV